MATKFTPGPWGLHTIGPNHSINGAWIISLTGCKIARMPAKADKAIYQKRADAKLITAAPDLYEALADILGPLNVCTDNLNVRDDACLPIDMTMGEVRKGRAALARARGES